VGATTSIVVDEASIDVCGEPYIEARGSFTILEHVDEPPGRDHPLSEGNGDTAQIWF